MTYIHELKGLPKSRVIIAVQQFPSRSLHLIFFNLNLINDFNSHSLNRINYHENAFSFQCLDI